MTIEQRNAVAALKMGLINWFQYFEIIKALPIIIFAMAITACGGSSGSPESAAPAAGVSCQTLQGHYYDQFAPSNTLDIAGDCTFTDSVCGYTATYSVPDQNSGATVITVAGTNGTAGCMSSTAHSCTMGYNGVQLAISCDSGAHSYLFIK